MTLKDAAVVSMITALITFILTFFADASLGQVLKDPGAFIFDAVKTYMVAWAGNFLTLAGLEQYVKRTGKEESETG